VIRISPNAGDIKDYVEMRLARDTEPEAMNDDLRADIVRAVLEKISDMCVRVFPVSTLPTMYTDQQSCVVSSSFL